MGAGDDAVWEDIALLADPPVVFLIQQATQSIPDNTATAITFGTGSNYLDDYGFHSESVNNARITPNRAGKYEFGGEYVTQGMTTPASRQAYIRKNGTDSRPAAARDTGATITSSPGGTSTIMTMNGSTDYAELMGVQDSSGAVSTSATSQLSSTFWCKYLGPS